MIKFSKDIIPEDITIERLYVFKRFAGEHCELYFGLQRFNDGVAYRWMVKGNAIPFPVFSGTWFIGLPRREMINFMERQGYRLVSNTELLLPTNEALNCFAH